jgi:phosphate transport system substrate-binding protein
MKKALLGLMVGGLVIFSLTVGLALADNLLLINGAGATFPYPLYSKWFYEYTKVDPTVNFNYQAIGSGGGIRQITAETVDFGASDGALTDEQMKQAPGELLHIPMTAGAVVITYNLPGISQHLKLSPDVVADIFLGKISRWNDPRMVKDNPGVKLPGDHIIVAHRSDGSGTTNIFTDYLSSVSDTWKSKVGKGTSVNWPVGLGGKGNEGVSGLVKQTQGSVGYVELAYAVKNDLPYADIKNKAGNFIPPTIESTTAAVNGKINSMPVDFRVSLVNPDGEDAYPIAGLTWILVYKNQTDKQKGKKIVEFLRWAVTDGQKYSADLLYAPLPESLVKKIEERIDQISY